MKSPVYRILHLSDIHFGRTHDHVVELIPKFKIDLLILTGDLTQRATKAQFQAAESFLKKFSCPIFLIPGNHDVPLHNLFLRMFQPYGRFCAAMKDRAQDFYEDERVAIFGLWTVNKFTIQDGKLYSAQLKKMEEKMKKVSPAKFKIIAAHHPLPGIDLSEGAPKWQQVLGVKPNLLLWGHQHQSGVEMMKAGPILLAAGTGFSSRLREETNSYNLIELEQDQTRVEIYHYSDASKLFAKTKEVSFKQESRQADPTDSK